MSIFITLGAAVKAFSIEELSCKNAAVSVSLYLYQDCKILDLKREPWFFYHSKSRGQLCPDNENLHFVMSFEHCWVC